MRSVEAIFGGILALLVLGAAVFMLAGGEWGRGGGQTSTGPVVIGQPTDGSTTIATGTDVLCQCFNQAYDLAGESVDVMSSQYRTGFESCRAVGGPKGGDAWTAGWNARLSSRSFQASCSAWLRRA